ncbi:tyrosinase family protein [Pontibacter sp. 13R65]|uniref:tyrosinase family protein n=1 Tax=Pontibacter sp. 13R65 TaxID=3127458 RepID=UPI00301D7E77
MAIEILINNSLNSSANFISWSPAPCRIRETNPPGGTTPIAVTLRNRTTTSGGQIVFLPSITGPEQNQLQLNLPADGSPVEFFIAGMFGRPSVANRDAIIRVVNSAGNTVGEKQLMVRIRKNANNLTTGERDRFLNAFATLNNRGMGRFRDFRNMHLSNTEQEGHRNVGFLPWHRAYLLDLERELQLIDPSVSLPYWKFDAPAPRVFSREFMGTTGSNGRVVFNSSNPLSVWATDGVVGINRSPRFNTSTSAAPVMTEVNTMRLGTNYDQFDNMETNPHGSAHTSFNGYIREIGEAARDPLFFMLHTNADRLWAKWQWANNRFNSSASATYPFSGSAGTSGATRVGHNLRDTMWPWNQITASPRPPAAPGGNFPSSSLVSAPSRMPIVGEMIDFQGKLNSTSKLGFDYDDVPFEFAPAT